MAFNEMLRTTKARAQKKIKSSKQKDEERKADNFTSPNLLNK